MDNLNVRTAMYENNGLWDSILPCNIKTGMFIMLFEPSGEVVCGDRGEVVFEAISDAYIDKNGVVGFQYKYE